MSGIHLAYTEFTFAQPGALGRPRYSSTPLKAQSRELVLAMEWPVHRPHAVCLTSSPQLA